MFSLGLLDRATGEDRATGASVLLLCTVLKNEDIESPGEPEQEKAGGYYEKPHNDVTLAIHIHDKHVPVCDACQCTQDWHCGCEK